MRRDRGAEYLLQKHTARRISHADRSQRF